MLTFRKKNKLIVEHPALFFKKELDHAFLKHHLTPPETTTVYLINLLIHYMNINALTGEDRIDFFNKPLSQILAETEKKEFELKYRTLKETADTVLYMMGFFFDHIDKNIVDSCYYMSIGEATYHRLSGMTQNKNPLSDTFLDLSNQFALYVSVLKEVSLNGLYQSNKSLLKLYEKWRKTKAIRLEKHLKKSGLLNN